MSTFKSSVVGIAVLVGTSCTEAPSGTSGRNLVMQPQAPFLSTVVQGGKAQADAMGGVGYEKMGAVPADAAPPLSRHSPMAALQATGPVRLRRCTTLTGTPYQECLKENADTIAKVTAKPWPVSMHDRLAELLTRPRVQTMRLSIRDQLGL